MTTPETAGEPYWLQQLRQHLRLGFGALYTVDEVNICLISEVLTHIDTLAARVRETEGRRAELNPLDVQDVRAEFTDELRDYFGEVHEEFNAHRAVEEIVHLRAQLTAATERAERVDLLEIPKQPGLDPIRAIFLDHEPGKGTLIVQCYNEAWTCYFGAMGKRTLREFVASVDRGYLGGAMRCGNPTYRERVANAVILSCRAALAAAAPTEVRDGA